MCIYSHQLLVYSTPLESHTEVYYVQYIPDYQWCDQHVPPAVAGPLPHGHSCWPGRVQCGYPALMQQYLAASNIILSGNCVESLSGRKGGLHNYGAGSTSESYFL